VRFWHSTAVLLRHSKSSVIAFAGLDTVDFRRIASYYQSV